MKIHKNSVQNVLFPDMEIESSGMSWRDFYFHVSDAVRVIFSAVRPTLRKPSFRREYEALWKYEVLLYSLHDL